MHKYDTKTKNRLIQAYLSSGLSKKAFAEKHNIKVTTFKNWIYRKASSPEPSNALTFHSIKLNTPQQAPDNRSTGNIVGRLLLRQGAILEITSGMSADWVSQLLTELRNASC